MGAQARQKGVFWPNVCVCVGGGAGTLGLRRQVILIPWGWGATLYGASLYLESIRWSLGLTCAPRGIFPAGRPNASGRNIGQLRLVAEIYGVPDGSLVFQFRRRLR